MVSHEPSRAVGGGGPGDMFPQTILKTRNTKMFFLRFALH